MTYKNAANGITVLRREGAAAVPKDSSILTVHAAPTCCLNGVAHNNVCNAQYLLSDPTFVLKLYSKVNRLNEKELVAVK